jgi:hypothetical protein
MVKVLKKLERALGTIGLVGWHSFQMKCTPWSRFISKVRCTIKTHKGPCSVSIRLLHSSPKHPFASVAKVLNCIMREKLSSIDFLHKSTDSFLKSVARCRPEERISFVKCDVKDFYMSGSTSEMTSSAFKHCSPEVRSAASAILEHILRTQVVKCDQTGATYAVCKGSGMGSVVSGDVSDIALYWLVEYDIDDKLLRSNGI